MQPSPDPAEHIEAPVLRRQKLEQLRAQQVDPFSNALPVTHDCGVARQLGEDGTMPEGTPLTVAGRVTAIRNMGGTSFLDLRDATGRIQIFLKTKQLPPGEVEVFRQLDLGDILGVTGVLFRTKMGEISVRSESFTLLSKSLQQLPEKFHGLADIETRYRQRYLDLISNPDSCAVFTKRSQILRAIRDFLHARGFAEVETPMMQSVPGGAAAEPFKTHHKALGIPLYLRIAPELYLKRLLIGGMTKIFEIGRNFRNEGISRRHNPEFTMLEAYQAYSDCAGMMELVQSLVTHVATTVLGTLVINFRDEEGNVTRTIDLTGPWRQVSYKTLVCEVAGDDWFTLAPAEMRARAETKGLHPDESSSAFELTNGIFEKLIEPTLINPTFVTQLPRELVPLAKATPGDPTTVDVFECCINGQEISPGYSEQNDPLEQRRQLEHQAGEETQKVDEDFLAALEYGMPPAGGIGIGIDRLCMLLLAQENIRDVILFPLLKPRQ